MHHQPIRRLRIQTSTLITNGKKYIYIPEKRGKKDTKKKNQTLHLSSLVLGGDPSRAVFRASTGLCLGQDRSRSGTSRVRVSEEESERNHQLNERDGRNFILFEQAFDFFRFVFDSCDDCLGVVGPRKPISASRHLSVSLSAFFQSSAHSRWGDFTVVRVMRPTFGSITVSQD